MAFEWAPRARSNSKQQFLMPYLVLQTYLSAVAVCLLAQSLAGRVISNFFIYFIFIWTTGAHQAIGTPKSSSLGRISHADHWNWEPRIVAWFQGSRLDYTRKPLPQVHLYCYEFCENLWNISYLTCSWLDLWTYQNGHNQQSLCFIHRNFSWLCRKHYLVIPS